MDKKPKYKKLYLRCTFSDAEMAGLAEVMAEKTQEIRLIEATAKAAAIQFKSEKEAAQNEIDNAARKYRDGYEMRDVECEEVINFEAGMVSYYRVDNGQLVKERAITEEDRQLELSSVTGCGADTKLFMSSEKSAM